MKRKLKAPAQGCWWHCFSHMLTKVWHRIQENQGQRGHIDATLLFDSINITELPIPGSWDP